jgi:hypothetical protein
MMLAITWRSRLREDIRINTALWQAAVSIIEG